MALYTRKQFYELCGIGKSHLNVYISRSKVILDGELIDDNNPTNKLFLAKCLEKKQANVESKPQPKVNIPQVENSGDQIIQKSIPDKNINELERALKEAELKKKEVDIQLALLKEEKLRGVVIPTDIVKVVFSQHFKSITSAFHQAADNLIVNIAKKKDLDREEVAQIRGELIEITNLAINDSVDNSIKNIKNIVAEYSEKKGVGERI